MARFKTVVTTEGEIGLLAATTKTVLQAVAPANQRVACRGWSISFDGTSGAAEPVQVDLLFQTTAGTMSAATPVSEDGLGAETIQVTAQKNATAEPTSGGVIRRYEVHPQTGMEMRYSPDEEILIKGGARLGLRVTAPAIVNCVAHFSLEE
jgi:hypothetical protein